METVEKIVLTTTATTTTTTTTTTKTQRQAKLFYSRLAWDPMLKASG